jgi:outer membrane protein TolC
MAGSLLVASLVAWPAIGGREAVAQAPKPETPAPAALPTTPRREGDPSRPVRRRDDNAVPPPVPITPTILDPNVRPIDLNTALTLANVQNPELNLARQLVLEASALRMLAAAQIIPTLNIGANYDGHQGVLQQSNGNILSVNRSAVYVGAGANAIAAGTVNIPGLVLTGNIAQGVFGYLSARQVVRARAFASVAVRNQTFLRVTLLYSELIRAEGGLAIAMQNRDEVREVARLTADYAATGEGRKADADRAATQLARREALVQQAEGQLLVASANLCRELNLDPALRLHPTDAYIVPLPIVPDPIPLPELIALGLLNRPELAERRASIRAALMQFEGSKVLPFSPTILIGLSAGGFGGGSNLVQPVFGGFGGRADLDAYSYWTLQNLGVGNLALIRTAKAEFLAQRYREIAMLNIVRSEVAMAYARTHARYAQIGTYEVAVRSGLDGFQEDFIRIRERGEHTALPIELLNNFDLLAESRKSYLDAIVDYNRSQFELFVALGQPPAAALAHQAPVNGVAPSRVVGSMAPNGATMPGPAATVPAGGAPAPPPAAALPPPPVSPAIP